MYKKLVYLLLIGILVVASSCSKPAARSNMQPRSTLSDIDVGNQYSKAPKKHRKKKKSKYAAHVNEYAEAKRKAYKKEERIASRPQYTNQTYFGHKKKPKKRKRGKRKFCKECGIVH